MTAKIRFNNEFLQQFCKENGIELTKDYSLDKVNRRFYIEAKCLMKECNNTCIKDFRNLVKNGCYCGSCMYLKNDKIRYDLKYLQNYCNENNIILLEDYTNIQLNRETIITSKCLTDGCENICIKHFRLFLESGSNCNNCTELKRINKLKKSSWKSEKIRYNNQYLDVYCNENNIILLEDYTNIQLNRETIVTAKCLSEDCKNKVEKSFRRIVSTGCYCNNCSIVLGKEKSKQTSLEKYGTEYPAQNAEVSEKSSKHAYKAYNFVFPSGRIERIQGYEKYMLNDLLQKEGILEDDIVVKRSDVPSVWYEDASKKKRRYFVDCFIKSQNRCIEAKSTWTAAKKKDCIYLKQHALKEAGFKCEIWIYDGKGELVEKIC